MQLIDKLKENKKLIGQSIAAALITAFIVEKAVHTIPSLGYSTDADKVEKVRSTPQQKAALNYVIGAGY